MGKYDIRITDDTAEKIIKELFDKLEIGTYGELRDDTPYFISTFQWLNPKLRGIVNGTVSAAKFLAGIFSCAGMDKEEVVKAATNFYNFYNDSDLIPDYRDEDGY